MQNGVKGISVSVALAAYDGGKYIAQQLESVIPQLREGDEIVVSDDFPEGTTRAAIEPFLLAGAPVKYIRGPGRGVIRNFEYAIGQCSGDVIFLCDQDDVWLPGKLERVLAAFTGDTFAVMHNARITNENLEPTGVTLFEINGAASGTVHNIVKNTFTGCCMAFRRELLEYILPFPQKIPMHDQWIGIRAQQHGGVALIEEPLLLYRRHGGALTGGKTSLADKLRWRAQIIHAVMRGNGK